MKQCPFGRRSYIAFDLVLWCVLHLSEPTHVASISRRCTARLVEWVDDTVSPFGKKQLTGEMMVSDLVFCFHY